MKLLAALPLLFVLFPLCGGGCSTAVLAADAPPPPLQPFKVRATLSRTHILPGELIGVAVLFQNTSKTPQTIDWWDGPPNFWIRYRKKGDRDWNDYTPYLTCTLGLSPDAIPRRTFAPNEEGRDFLTLGPDHRGFNQPRDYEVEAVRAERVQGELQYNESKPQLVTIDTPPVTDVAVLHGTDTLLSLEEGNFDTLYGVENEPVFFYSAAFAQDPASLTRERELLNRIVAQSPTSRFAHYARRALITFPVFEIAHRLLGRATVSEAEKQSVAEAVTALQALAKTQPPDIAVTTDCNAGFLSLALGESADQIEAFQQARRLSPTQNTSDRIESLVRWYHAIAAPPRQPTPPNPQEILHRTAENLKRDGFDVDNFARLHPTEYKSYLSFALPLLAKHTRGEMTATEYYSRITARFDAIVRATK